MSFYENLLKCTHEPSEVQPIYRAEIIKLLKKGDNYNSKRSIIVGKSDGIIPAKYQKEDNGENIDIPFLLMIECKKDESFKETSVRSRTLLQVICMLKEFKEKGEELPKVIVLGSKIDCFSLPIDCLLSYIDRDIVGYTAGSTAYTYKENKKILKEISEDNEISKSSSIIYDTWVDMSMESLVKGCVLMAKDMKLKFEVTEQNISKVFDFFTMQVLDTKKDSEGRTYKVYADGSEITAREQVNLFMSWLLGINDTKNYYYHPTKKGLAVFGDKIVKVKRNAYLAFQNTYKLDKYALKDKKVFTATCDRLIEDADRRTKGDFYTPTAWVDESHKMISETFGDNWKDEYIVWDCACGTKNLTRDYKFKRLYSSTIEKGDIELSKRYNQTIGDYEGVAFQYDFLNDDVVLFDELLQKKKNGYVISIKDFDYSQKGNTYCKLAQFAPGLLAALLENKPIIFFINPPYGTANNLKTKSSGEDAKTGVAKTEINKLMLKDKVGASSQQLYSQFLNRIQRLKELFDLENCKIALFSKSALISSQSFEGFRKIFKKDFNYEKGMMFQASQFADCSGDWGVLFSIWGNKQEQEIDNVSVAIKEMTIDGIVEKSSKILWNMDNKISCSDWIKEPIKNLPTFDAPQLSSGVICKQKGIGKLAKGSIGYYVNGGNNIYKNGTDVYIVNSCSSMGHGISILSDNFYRVISNFAARKLITQQYANWINDKDEYMMPNINHSLYKQWESDCLVYSLFNTSSNQTSLRGIDYNGKKWDIKNEWFFMSEDEMSKLSSGYYNQDDQNDDIEIDIENFGGDRFVYKELRKAELSEDAKNILNRAKELIKKSFEYRDLFNEDHPEYYINTWDAGWYQIKALLKEYFTEDLEEFNKMYHQFEDRMRLLVYDLGFLYL